ncbi:O-acetyl-ADP-ribose deacetylase [Mucilaginibacter sp. HMF7410]|uniref:O-acetyl-ADP-ribose deacetylase n=2 Tax=Mucilaginibacter arboris TaxID=2682090 RepID=A0A7K1T1F3_9SPHI|nr:O-acetyl-ADP-ribose deacetylase [Mucilaginibacter arboris]
MQVVQGDITKIAADAIINAANSSLLGGGGVDGAIHRAGGKTILEECKAIVARLGRCPTGEAVITTGGNLPAKYVIHTVGPVWNGGKKQEEEKLADCYTNSLKLAAAHRLTSIAFPNISTGVYRFPKEKASRIAVQAVRNFMQGSNEIMQVIFVCYDEENFNLIRKYLDYF